MPASEVKPSSGEEFLSRWSRRKQTARAEEQQPPAPAPARPAVADAPPVLPPLDSLTPDSDFTGFLHPKVDEGLRRAALKKLFSDPHFNVMDGLDIYIDDYSKDDPIPEAMMKELRHAQDILRASRERREEEAQREALREAQRRREAGLPPEDGEPAQVAALADDSPELPQALAEAAPDAVVPLPAEAEPETNPVKRA
jgi:hypothetical protein